MREVEETLFKVVMGRAGKSKRAADDLGYQSAALLRKKLKESESTSTVEAMA